MPADLANRAYDGVAAVASPRSGESRGGNACLRFSPAAQGSGYAADRSAAPSGEHRKMERQATPSPPARWLADRVQRSGMRPRNAAYIVVSFWAVAIVVFGVIERLVDPDTFDNVWLGMWWGIQTVTTVGYGDIVPGSTAGKAIASFLMLGGLSILALVTGAITSAFVARAEADRRAAGEDPVMLRLEDVTTQLAAIKAQLASLERGSDAGG